MIIIGGIVFLIILGVTALFSDGFTDFDSFVAPLILVVAEF